MSETAHDRWRLLEGDSVKLLQRLPMQSVDAVVTDPPYGIDFRREAWDGRQIRSADKERQPGDAYAHWTRSWAAECLRVLKPGGHLLAFGAPRTAHRLASGLELAGFELRDQLLWLYGTGVPKSGARDGRSTTLKPAYEPILLARAPLEGTLAESEARWRTGRLEIDAARIPTPGRALGRWPSNITLSHDETCRNRRCTTTCPVAQLDNARPDTRPSRFFYCPKPSRSEREAGCESLPAVSTRIYGTGAVRPRRNTHPTVKPVELMAWLIHLACPPDGLLLDPFAGSGSTGIAALHEQRRFLGIEQDPTYAEIARARLAHASGGSGLEAPAEPLGRAA
jgi:site-specific DNA-methyltransferase (adenine-specific)